MGLEIPSQSEQHFDRHVLVKLSEMQWTVEIHHMTHVTSAVKTHMYIAKIAV